VQPEDLAAILFTSGSTGVAKGAIYTQGIFAAQVELLRTVYQIEPGEVDLCTFPLFALFGPALGMSCVLPDMNASRPITLDPRRILSQMRQFEVTNFFGSPAVLRRLIEVTASEPPIPSLRRILSAGAPVTAEVIEFMQPIQPPGVELFTPYGATEALPVANMSSQEILRETAKATSQGAGICIGRPFPQVTVRIIAITDEPIPNWADVQELPVGAIGEFCVSGPIVTPGYVRRPEQTRLAKIQDGATLWHRMGDVGYFDEMGRIWYCGRKSHRVETKQGPLFTECVEGIFNTVVQRSALVGVTRNGITYPVLCVDQSFRRQRGVRYRLPSWDELVVQLRAKAAERPLTQPIQTFLNYPKPGFPVDVRHNAKIFREKLALWADQQLGPAWNGEATP
jgi:acyl-CoA synthetase (AMP-forming)/AMP-acid ligase II